MLHKGKIILQKYAYKIFSCEKIYIYLPLINIYIYISTKEFAHKLDNFSFKSILYYYYYLLNNCHLFNTMVNKYVSRLFSVPFRARKKILYTTKSSDTCKFPI